MSDDKWIECPHCGKRLLKRTREGVFHFKFGKLKDDKGDFIGSSPVDMQIAGSILMKCISRDCRKEVRISNLPFSGSEDVI